MSDNAQVREPHARTQRSFLDCSTIRFRALAHVSFFSTPLMIMRLQLLSTIATSRARVQLQAREAGAPAALLAKARVPACSRQPNPAHPDREQSHQRKI